MPYNEKDTRLRVAMVKLPAQYRNTDWSDTVDAALEWAEMRGSIYECCHGHKVTIGNMCEGTGGTNVHGT